MHESVINEITLTDLKKFSIESRLEFY